MYQTRIREAYSQLSAGYRRVADFVLNNYRDVAFMTAAQVAVASKVDTALVVRFAQRLGYPGYPELLAEVRGEVKKDLRAVYEPPQAENTTIDIYQRSLIEDSNSLQYMLRHLDTPTIEKVVAILKNAPRIFVIGEGVSLYLAEALSLRLAGCGFNIRVIPGDLTAHIGLIASMSSGDAMIGLDMTLLSRNVGVGLRLAREDGVHTIAIVNSAANHAARTAEYVLYAPVSTIGIFYSLSACVTVLHALESVLLAQKSDYAADWAMRSDRLLRQYTLAWRESPLSVGQIVAEYNFAQDGDRGEGQQTAAQG
ncbi:MAG: MurR/RpiR family transcriptional regulator [Chloroflexi bacterium]|nr:MurR/RpiR family transcriptional regulator [Chloroflexota bacterium]